MAETQIKGTAVGDGTITEVDISLANAGNTSLTGLTEFVIWDTTNVVLKRTTVSELQTYLNTNFDGWFTNSYVGSGSSVMMGSDYVSYVYNGGGIGSITASWALPYLSASSNRMFFVKNAGARAMIVTTNGSDKMIIANNTEVTETQLEIGEWCIFTSASTTKWYAHKYSQSTGGGGGLTSVGLSMPDMFVVGNSPLTNNGTIAVSLDSQIQNRVFASPTEASGAPYFRPLVRADIPDLSTLYMPLTSMFFGEGNLLGRPWGADDGYPMEVSLGYGLGWDENGCLTAIGGGGSGTVTSVGLSLPGIFSVTGSPVTTTGTLSASLVSQKRNWVFAAPVSTNGVPSFRALLISDLPDLSSTIRTSISLTTTGTGGAATYNSSTGVLNIPNYVASGGSGLTSVGLSMPNIFSVSNSPLTANGTIGVSLVSQIKNRVLASPDNINGVPYFRTLTQKDIPALPYDNFGTLLVNGATIIGSEGIYQQGTNYRGISIGGGTGITVNSSSGTHQELVLTINSTGGGSGFTNTIQCVTLTTNSTQPAANTWKEVLTTSLTEVGLYLINYHITLAKDATTAARLGARILLNGITTLASTETYTPSINPNYVHLSGTAYTNFVIGKELIVSLEFISSSTLWYAKASLESNFSSASNATQMTIVQIS